MEGEGQSAEVFYYQLDHLGTPQELTCANGELAWAGQYRAYGNLKRKVAHRVDTPLRFQGQYFDEETGLHYNHHRYNNPNTGHFLTPDPIKLTGGYNNYQYVPNPINWVDPLGLKCLQDKISIQEQEQARQELRDRHTGPPDLPEYVKNRYPNAKEVTADEAKLLTRRDNGGPNARNYEKWINKKGGKIFYDLDSDTVIYAKKNFVTSTKGTIDIAIPYKPDPRYDNHRMPDFSEHVSERVDLGDIEGGSADYSTAWQKLSEDLQGKDIGKDSDTYIRDKYNLVRKINGDFYATGGLN